MTDTLQIKIIAFNSDWHTLSIDLRNRILRAPLGLTYTKEQLDAEKDQTHIIAHYNDKIVGVLLLQQIDSTTLKMRQVVVEGSLQKTGIGTQLVSFAENFAKKEHFHKIILHARDIAMPFYLKLDYKIKGNTFIEVGIPHYLMEKEIA